MAPQFIPNLPSFYKYLCQVPKVIQTPSPPEYLIFIDATPTQIATTSKEFTYIRRCNAPIFENEAATLLEQLHSNLSSSFYSNNQDVISCVCKGSSNNEKVNNWLQHLAIYE
ncbi:hypothetical protein HMI56_005991 [Coelomomyces lativittatus]|nr:hypothetical protein HMI56_005991 [Coelomomyces lativittatus]